MCPASAQEDVKGATQVAPTVTKISRIPGTTAIFKKRGDIRQNIEIIYYAHKDNSNEKRRLTQGKQKAPEASVCTHTQRSCLHVLL